jgi:SAM-dependent methyltransferase
MARVKLQEKTFSSDEYTRQRLRPRAGDPLYLHLSDLLNAIRGNATGGNVKVLDFGAGSSPYEGEFPGASYFKADIDRFHDVNFVISEDDRVPAPSNEFDIIISTQVAEHVTDPAVYFEECYRLLRPGGRLLLSTHGMYEDHGCPSDYQRWTANGLTRDLARAGFHTEKILKLTTGPRALLFFVDRYRDAMRTSRRNLSGWAHWVVRLLYSPLRLPAHVLADYCFSGCRVVNAGTAGHDFYVGLLAVSFKPED